MAPTVNFEQKMATSVDISYISLLQMMNFVVQFICSIYDEVSSATLLKEKSLQEAAMAGNFSSVQLLLAEEINPSAKDKEGYTPLHWAAARGHHDIVEILLQSDVSLEEKGGKFEFTPLHMAAGEGHLKICEILLNKGADVNSVDRFNDIPLHWAAWFGHLPIVQFLVQHGSNITAKNESGDTPVNMASFRGHQEVVQWLHLQTVL